MSDRSHRHGLVVGSSPGAGRGVFAAEPFARGDVLEVAPVLVVPRSQVGDLDRTGLRYYVWKWGDGVAVGLGMISLVNHGETANAEWGVDPGRGELRLTAIADIASGDEIIVDYTAKGGMLPFAPRHDGDD